ncbi:TPA: hypothetical protein MXV65_002432 [Pseudomonas aeruginosa]|nr:MULTISPECIES: hypothetical protein [Pseudomonas]MBH9519081.1 hypothetical protein [Pseudomonas aeruginosa]MBI8577238.1 hypothetical protein [Pseudomonas aeruginosa]MBI8804387.1 hypothetical protein [Pseudomonas aeruginosa]MBX5565795.1 hypothetical protein [Pseudomonas aeruginosa]MCU9208640.1 hypothetical protein [Pseudomonas aeruginosa]
MSIIANLQLNQWQEHQLPDSCASPSHYLTVDGDFVISRTTDGAVVSRYQDDSWNMKPYDAKGLCVYNFVSWAEGSTSNQLVTVIIEEMKRLQLARMYLYRRPRKPNSIRMTVINDLARLALNNNLSLSQLFEDANLNRLLLPSFAALGRAQMRLMLKLIKELFDVRLKHREFKFAPAEYVRIERMQALYDEHPKAQRDEPKQTKLIPSRLYAALIAALDAELDAFNANGEAIVEFCRRRKDNPHFGMPTRDNSRYKDTVDWGNAVSQMGLGSLFEKLSVTDWRELFGYLGQIQLAAKYWIHLFSGMRDNEARHLPADTFTTIIAAGVDITILRGYTSKIAGENQTETFWITIPIIERGVIAARYVGKIAALRHGFDESDLSQYPLFPMLGRRGDYQVFKGAPVAGSSSAFRLDKIMARLPDMVVQEADIRELEQFDGFRNWRNDSDVKVGQAWPLATHQCRRSLAVYSARSGMVSVGSLGLQLKQLTEVMTSYYRRGNAFAVNFLQTEESQLWLDELEYERRKAQFIDFEANVINSTSRLWGGEGNRIQAARDKGRPLIITTDRAATQKKFEKGEMVYKLGPIGGCTNLEPCDKLSFTSIFACLDCEKSILDDDRSLKNIKRGVNNLKRGQSLFAPENPQYKQIESEISAIYEKLEKRGLLEKLEDLA